MSEELLRVLAVNGRGIEKIEATIAQVSLSVEAQGEIAAEVQQEVANKSSAVVDLLKVSNVDRLKTTGIKLNRYENRNREVTKYFYSNTVSFRTSIDSVGTLLQETTKIWVTRINGVNFTATEEAISSAKQEALRKATINARTKAEVVLDSLKFEIKEIIRIELDNARIQESYNLRRPDTQNYENTESFRESLDMYESSVMPIVGGELTVNAMVTLQISY